MFACPSSAAGGRLRQRHKLQNVRRSCHLATVGFLRYSTTWHKVKGPEYILYMPHTQMANGYKQKNVSVRRPLHTHLKPR